MGYLCANFSLPRPLCSRLRPDVRDRQRSDVHHRLMPLPYGRGVIILLDQLAALAGVYCLRVLLAVKDCDCVVAG